MARNVEIKARVDSLAPCEARLVEIATAGPEDLCQHDTFFACTYGRLKLRRFDDAHGELIFYRRDDANGPTRCDYERSATGEPRVLERMLASAYGVIGTVEKRRRVYLVGRTRAHLDRVAGLGVFMELEVVLGDDESEIAGQREAEQLMRMLGIEATQLIDCAYIDLLEA